MNCRKFAAVSFAAALALAVGGCAPDDSQADGGRRTRAPARPSFSFGRKNDAVAQKNSDKNRQQANHELGNLSPETSMERDLKRLRASETAQLKRVEELRGNIDQRSDLIRREEEKLADLQKRIEDYDVALQRYDMAARARPPREFGGETAVVPEEMFQDRPVYSSRSAALNDSYAAGTNVGSAPAAGPADYHDRMRQLPPRDIYAAAPPADYPRTPFQSGEILPPRNEFQPPVNVTTRELPPAAAGTGGETLLYRSGEAPQVVNTASYRIGDAGLTPTNAPPTVAKTAPAGKPFAGAPVGRANQPLNARVGPGPSSIPVNPDEEWQPDVNLFSKSKAAPAVQPYPGLGNHNAGANSAGNPSQGSQTGHKPLGEYEQTEEVWPKNPAPVRVTLPAKSVKPVAVPPAKPTPAAEPNFEDEVFTPDLFLSRR